MVARHQLFALFTQLPEKAGHDRQPFTCNRGEHVFVNAVLAAGRIGMGHPQRREAEDIGKYLIGQ